MSTIQGSQRKEAITRIKAALSDETRCQIVRILREDSGTVSLQDLAEQLAATNSEGPATTDAGALQVRLHHVHLPKLAEYGLVDWDKTEQTVSATDSSVYENGPLGELIINDGEDSSSEILTNDRRRAVLTAVKSQNGSITRESLARKLARQESTGQPMQSSVRDIEIQLHHQHLPKLAQADLIEYDPDNGTVDTVSNQTRRLSFAETSQNN